MDESTRQEALFRYTVLGTLLARVLERGELKRGLEERAAQTWVDAKGRRRTIAAKTLEEWFYKYQRHGFDGLMPAPRNDRGKIRCLSPDAQELIIAMKREDPGRSAALIARELIGAGILERGRGHLSAIRRLLKNEGLSGPCFELERPERRRWQATTCGELWQGDALHGPTLHDPSAGRKVRVKVFALIDDRSRLVTYACAFFNETQQAFLTVLLAAVLRRGIPKALLLDNHGSFTGSDVQLACAQLRIRLLYTRPHDGPAKGKIERWWRTLRGDVLDRLEKDAIASLDDLNVRLSAYIEGDYNQRPHSAHGGRSPLGVWEDDAEAIRWVEDPRAVARRFHVTLTRRVRNDSTCQIHGSTYEVPGHLRGQTIEINHDLLHPDRFWLRDGDTQVPLRPVDPEHNGRTPRRRGPCPDRDQPKTGLNPVEDLLRRFTRPKDRKDSSDA